MWRSARPMRPSMSCALANEIRCPWFFQMLADPRLKPLKERPEFAAFEASLAAMEANAST